MSCTEQKEHQKDIKSFLDVVGPKCCYNISQRIYDEASDGNWGYKNILRCSLGKFDPLEMVGQAITGKTSGATGC